jgi:hypothetical protein
MAPARPSQRFDRWANGWLGAHAKVNGPGQGGLAAEGDHPGSSRLAKDDDHLVVQVEVAGEHDPGRLRDPHPVSRNSRRMAASRRLVTSRPSQDFSSYRPLEERLEAPVAVQGRGGLQPSSWSAMKARTSSWVIASTIRGWRRSARKSANGLTASK